MAEVTRTTIYLKGDATSPQVNGNRIIAHICNDIGGWGKGFVLAISRRWTAPEAAYRKWYRERNDNDFELGSIQLIKVESSIWVANMIAQHGIRSEKQRPPIRYDALERCLQKLSDSALKLNASVHMPRIGCGLAGGKWEDIESLVDVALLSRGVAVFVYDLA
jgi:O-acetyl-ADP-ribose deacetylase (regulator of RNase III)